MSFKELNDFSLFQNNFRVLYLTDEHKMGQKKKKIKEDKIQACNRSAGQYVGVA